MTDKIEQVKTWIGEALFQDHREGFSLKLDLIEQLNYCFFEGSQSTQSWYKWRQDEIVTFALGKVLSKLQPIISERDRLKEQVKELEHQLKRGCKDCEDAIRKDERDNLIKGLLHDKIKSTCVGRVCLSIRADERTKTLEKNIDDIDYCRTLDELKIKLQGKLEGK